MTAVKGFLAPGALREIESASRQCTAIMAANYPPGPAKLGPVMTGHRVEIQRAQAVDADAIAAMLNPRAVDVAALSEMDADMGAALWPPEEDQVSGNQLLHIIRLHRDGVAEPLLLVGIPGQPDPRARKGCLDQS